MSIDQQIAELEEVKTLQVKALQYLQTSRMQNTEKKMRFAMIPYMNKEYIQKLITILEKEASEVANLYISLLHKQVN